MGETQKAALPATLRKKNYLAILNIFREKEALSANEVSERTGISRATVMKAVNHFIDKGMIESAGKGASTDIGGKKPELFRFCMKRYLICIGLWGNQMVASLYDLTETMLFQKTLPYSMKENREEFLDRIQNMSEDLLSNVENGKELFYGMSLCMGGFLDTETGILQYSILTPEWGEKIPLKELLKERFPNVEIIVENVACMSACAAVLDNSQYEQQRVAVLYTDVDVSACYIDRGHVAHGTHSLIGEVGLMSIALPNTVPYTPAQESFFATLISEKTLCANVLGDPMRLNGSVLHQYADCLKMKHIFLAADQGDGLAKAVVREAAWVFSAALHNIVVNFDPDTVIIQGEFSHAGMWFDQCLQEGIACFKQSTRAPIFKLEYDQRPIISLQMKGMTKVMTKKCFSSSEWL